VPPDRIVAHVPLPTTAPVTIVMDPQTPASPSSAPSIPAPTTQRIPLTTLVAQKEWNVTVVSIDTPDPNSLKPQIKDAQADVDRLEQSFEEAEKTLNKVSGEYRTESYFDGLGMRYRKVYNTAGIQAAERDMRNLRDERTDAKYKLAVLQKEEAKLPLRRNIAARLPDNTLCQIEVEGPPLTTTADAMKPNDKITVTGAPRIEDAALHIKPRTLAPAPQ
jgi:hypothetical protein